MRQPRIKIDPATGAAIYHCSSRTVNGERLLKDEAAEVLRKLIRQIAEGLGLTVLSYTILESHFHSLILAPELTEISDDELLRRFAILYPTPTRHQTRRLEVVREQLASNGPEAQKFRRQFMKLMNDVSQFMKLVKQRFTIWYNHRFKRFGTQWAERFKSSLAEHKSRILGILAAYIDLNSIRAGMATDPKDFRFSSYAEAVAGHEQAQQSLMFITERPTWDEAQAAYRQMLYTSGAEPRENKACFSETDLKRVIEEGGRLSIPAILRCRLRYFTDGAILGSKAFVNAQIASYRGKSARTRAHALPPVADWGDLAIMRPTRLK